MVRVSPDSTTVYAVASSDHSVIVFDRDLSTGLLTWQATHTDGVDGVDGLNGVRNLAVASDHAVVYTVSTGDDALTSFANGTILQLEWGDISGFAATEGQVVIRWEATATPDVEKYVLERKGKAGGFLPVATVPPLTGSGKVPYQYVDLPPGPGRYEYRVAAHTLNGQAAYSRKIEVTVDPGSGYACTLRIAPNPCTRSSYLYFPDCMTTEGDLAVMEVWDASGRNIATRQVQVFAGKVALFDLETPPLPTGIYWVMIRIRDAMWVEQVRVQVFGQR
jgi:hypothetical protein